MKINAAILDTGFLTCVDGVLQGSAETVAGVIDDATRTDADLLLEVQRRNSGALAQLYDRYASSVLGLALKILRNRTDAEDLVHDVFVEAWQCAAQYRPEKASVKTWLLLRTRSRALDRLRRLEIARRHAMAVALSPESPSESETKADERIATRALAQLSAPQRQVVELGYFRGLTCQEIATQCGIPVGTVKSRLSASLKKLRSLLRNGLDDSDD